jgi:hypothetical protein
MKRTIVLFFVLFIYTIVTAQVDSINQRIFLVGDAGELLGNKQPVVEWIRQHVDMKRTRFFF